MPCWKSNVSSSPVVSGFTILERCFPSFQACTNWRSCCATAALSHSEVDESSESSLQVWCFKVRAMKRFEVWMPFSWDQWGWTCVGDDAVSTTVGCPSINSDLLQHNIMSVPKCFQLGLEPKAPKWFISSPQTTSVRPVPLPLWKVDFRFYYRQIHFSACQILVIVRLCKFLSDVLQAVLGGGTLAPSMDAATLWIRTTGTKSNETKKPTT